MQALYKPVDELRPSASLRHAARSARSCGSSLAFPVMRWPSARIHTICLGAASVRDANGPGTHTPQSRAVARLLGITSYGGYGSLPSRGRQRRGCYSPSSNTPTVKKMLDFTGSVTMLRLARSKYEGRLPEAFCRRGTGAAPASEGLNATFVPGPYSGSLAGHYEPARSDHGQRHKGQDAALARRKARGVTLHAHRPEQSGHPPGAIRAMRLVGAPSPSIFEGDGREEERATPWPKAANRGRFSFDST